MAVRKWSEFCPIDADDVDMKDIGERETRSNALLAIAQVLAGWSGSHGIMPLLKTLLILIIKKRSQFCSYR